MIKASQIKRVAAILGSSEAYAKVCLEIARQELTRERAEEYERWSGAQEIDIKSD